MKELSRCAELRGKNSVTSPCHRTKQSGFGASCRSVKTVTPLACIFAAKPEITFCFLESPTTAVPTVRFVINLVNISLEITKSLEILARRGFSCAWHAHMHAHAGFRRYPRLLPRSKAYFR